MKFILTIDTVTVVTNKTLPLAKLFLMQVGDLLDGSSPASRRTMDEYFYAFQNLCEKDSLPSRIKFLIRDVRNHFG